MKLIVTNQIKQKDTGFYVELEFMSGDADAYEYEDLGPFQHEDIESFENFKIWLDNITDYEGDEIKMDKNMPENSNKYVENMDCKDLDPIFNFYWPEDSTCDHQIRATLFDYRVYFYQLGAEYEVEIEK